MAGTEMHYGASPKLFEYALNMRKNPTLTEKIVWDIVNSEPLAGYKFRRQHPIGSFIADFYSHRLKAVIEIDGGYHQSKEQRDFDSFRDSDMNAWGILVLRLKDTEVETEIALVREKIAKFAQQRAEQPPSKSP